MGKSDKRVYVVVPNYDPLEEFIMNASTVRRLELSVKFFSDVVHFVQTNFKQKHILL